MSNQLTKDKFLTDEELLLAKRLCERFPSRDTAMILLAIYTGARASELLEIRSTDLNNKLQSVYVRGMKGSRDREIPLPPEVYAIVKQYIPFNIKYDRLDDIWKMYRPVEKKFHSLRHTFAIQLYKRTRDIKLVQLALGHRNIATTQIYTEFVYSQEEMRRLIVSP